MSLNGSNDVFIREDLSHMKSFSLSLVGHPEADSLSKVYSEAKYVESDFNLPCKDNSLKVYYQWANVQLMVIYDCFESMDEKVEC